MTSSPRTRLAGLSILSLAAALMTAQPAAAIDIFGGQRTQGAPVIMAQAGDTSVRLSQMEDEIRRLTGKVEEMSFLVLQLQEQLRNAQADNDMRFQDLEGGSGGGGSGQSGQRSGALTTPPAAGSGDGDFAAAPQQSSSGSQISSAGSDEIGSILGASIDRGAFQTAPAGGSDTAASVQPHNESDLYGLGYNYLLAGEYVRAEETFRQYTQTYPSAENAGDAQYWLGESLYAQKKYREAAEVFLTAQKQHGTSAKGPEMLLKLGMSLAALDNRDTACATYAEVEKRYPQMSDNVRRKLQTEEQSSRCS
ncbi:tol-pal system protein YbgF [Aureimonas altamirensis]|uniref:tol-pal system protein YbgF n=1 Tax=Aureimonas altamirensis TaxID=370622 RepID=UPI001E4C4909|nr:tol-pal system protein YbgF [Aureimonas altamirensis]UHD45014.1 tol-pal system protein YbgF [Aureimonas altamirensis]